MKSATISLLLFCLVILIGWDVYVVLSGSMESSISSILVAASYDLPFLPFVAGVVCGHLFWRLRPNKDVK